MKSEIDTPSKRAKLAPRKNPYWQGVAGGRGGASLGYRKPGRGAGGWVAKIVVEGRRLEERIGMADDDGAAAGAMPFRAAVAAALDWSQRQNAVLDVQKLSGGARNVPTVRSAVAEYVASRGHRSSGSGANAQGRLAKYVVSDPEFADTPVAKIRAQAILNWRGRLPIRREAAGGAGGAETDASIAPATVNRLLNDLRAALNAIAEKHRRELPAYLQSEIRIGTRAMPAGANARKQILSDADVRRVIEGASTVDDTGDFGRLVLLAAATGARYSQLAALKVADLQIDRSRVMMPGSHKGRSARAKPPVPVPLSSDVLPRLQAAAAGRAADQPLLQRWAYRNVGPFKWERDHRRAWGPAYEVDKHWAATLVAAGLPADTVMYSLRHSSIVRGLRDSLPIRLVAVLHDTSVEMIEAHYSAFIADATEELARRATLSLASDFSAAPTG